MESAIDRKKQKGKNERYQIRVQGWSSVRWLRMIDANLIEHYLENERGPLLTIMVDIRDQAELRSLLNRIWDLNLTLISINQVNVEEIRRTP